MSSINWFPGHMAKTIRQLRQEFERSDIVIEILDARLPVSSRNPIIDQCVQEKHCHIIALTKIDLADPKATSYWEKELRKVTPHVFCLNVLKKQGIKGLLTCCQAFADQKNKSKRFYISKIMVCGIPNVGKSHVINALAKKRVAAVQNKPGVTKQTRGIMLGKHLEIMDTPGILWPKLDDQTAAIKLALAKSIKQTILNDYQLVEWFLPFMAATYPDLLQKRYRIDADYDDLETYLDAIASSMNWKTRDGERDEPRLLRSIIDDFQRMNFGRCSLDLNVSSDVN
ncbi:ribosome biogenesis GTPase YlqF [bacterium]|nr:ribosome biogenesis GTPase YlqF [bacterium]